MHWKYCILTGELSMLPEFPSELDLTAALEKISKDGGVINVATNKGVSLHISIPSGVRGSDYYDNKERA